MILYTLNGRELCLDSNTIVKVNLIFDAYYYHIFKQCSDKMCGRVSLISPFEFAEEYFQTTDRWEYIPQYNIAPGQQLVVIRLNSDNEIELTTLKWGFIPHWMSASKISSRFINARLETVQEKPMFRSAFQKQRCLVLVSGYYEWVQRDNRKIPYYISHKENRVLALAGMWSHWEEGSHSIDTCAIITTQANKLIEPYHDRMPFIVSEYCYHAWINRNSLRIEDIANDCAEISKLEIYEVNNKVNKASYNQLDCIIPYV